MNTELEGCGRSAVVAEFKLLYRDFLEANHYNLI
jgi:hypothetical protein